MRLWTSKETSGSTNDDVDGDPCDDGWTGPLRGKNEEIPSHRFDYIGPLNNAGVIIIPRWVSLATEITLYGTRGITSRNGALLVDKHDDGTTRIFLVVQHTDGRRNEMDPWKRVMWSGPPCSIAEHLLVGGGSSWRFGQANGWTPNSSRTRLNFSWIRKTNFDDFGFTLKWMTVGPQLLRRWWYQFSTWRAA